MGPITFVIMAENKNNHQGLSTPQLGVGAVRIYQNRAQAGQFVSIRATLRRGAVRLHQNRAGG